MLPTSLWFKLNKTAPPLVWNYSFLQLPVRQSLTPRIFSNVLLGRAFSTSTGSLKPNTTTINDTTTAVQRITWPRRNIRTLDPSKLIGDDYIDISLKTRPRLGILLRPDSSSTPSLPRPPQVGLLPCSSHSFPAGTHGFLYYHVPPSSSPLSGELRFRITSSCSPASFATGSDLSTERGMPWRYPLYKIVCRPSYRDLVALLLQDGLVSQRTLDLVTAAVAPLYRTSTNAPDAPRHPSRLPTIPVLSAFGQEFPFRYSTDLNFCGIFATQDTIFTHHIRHITSFQVLRDGKYAPYVPFKGSAVCCFERSTLPKHAGRRVVVIRVKRFIDSDPIRPVPPPSQGNARAHLIEQLRPREGELLNVATYDRVEPWAADVDRVWKGGATHVRSTPWKALRVLFENEELYGSPCESES